MLTAGGAEDFKNPAELEIRLLGDVQVLRTGRTLALPASRKTRALLAYLAHTGQPQRREHLCNLLWDGPDDPRAALRWSLTKLRPVLNAQARERLCTDRERVWLSLDDAYIDAHALRELLRYGTKQSDPAVQVQHTVRFIPTHVGNTEE